MKAQVINNLRKLSQVECNKLTSDSSPVVFNGWEGQPHMVASVKMTARSSIGIRMKVLEIYVEQRTSAPIEVDGHLIAKPGQLFFHPE